MANDALIEMTKTESKGYFEKLAMKVVDNIQIKIRGVHFRLEDHFSGDTSYTFGIVMRQLEICTTNSNWEP
jgi:vacuolar protein sorting-associated protein 13A/C